MPGPRRYRSRLFQGIHHHSVKTTRRAQRAWREIKAIASLGAQAIAYSFQRLWQAVQASHLQMPAAPRQARLAASSDSSSTHTTINTSSKAVARVLSLARSLPLLEGQEASLPLQAPALYSAPQDQRTVLPSLTEQSTQNLPALGSQKTAITVTWAGIRAISSQLDDRRVVLVTRHNELLDCLTSEQQTTLLHRIDTELALLAATPQPAQIVHQPHTWQESISRLALPAQRLRQLPAATERLLQSPIEHWQRLSQTAPLQTAFTHPFVEPLRELVTRIPTPKQASQIASQLALPPARQLVNLTAQLAAQLPKPTLQTALTHPLVVPLRELVTRIPTPKQASQIASQLALPPARQFVNVTAQLAAQLPKPPLPAVLKRGALLLPPSTSVQKTATPATTVTWKQHLQQQFQTLWHQTIQGNLQSLSTPPILPSRAEAFLEALPLARSAWAKRLLKPFRRSANHWPDLNALKSAEAPLLPPSPPQQLLTPATIGFLRPEARGYVVLSRTPQGHQEQTLTVGRDSQSHELRADDRSTSVGLKHIPTPAGSVSAGRLQPTANQVRSSKQRRKQSSLKKRSKQRQAAANTYIDVKATDLGYDTSVVTRGVNWLDRGVYAIEESALKAWQWWCELVEPEGAPKPINTLGASHEGRELLVAGTRRSQDIVMASAELGVALFQELWPMMWHLLQVLGRRAGHVTFCILEWMMATALPAAGRLAMTVLRVGANWAEKHAQSRNK